MISGINGFDSKLIEMSSQVPISVLPVLASSFTRTDIWKFLNKSFQRRVRDGVTCKERKFVIRGLSYQDFHASGLTSKCVLKLENNKWIQFFMSYCWVIIIGLYFKLSSIKNSTTKEISTQDQWHPCLSLPFSFVLIVSILPLK